MCFALVAKEVHGIKIRRPTVRRQAGRKEKEEVKEVPISVRMCCTILFQLTFKIIDDYWRNSLRRSPDRRCSRRRLVYYCPISHYENVQKSQKIRLNAFLQGKAAARRRGMQVEDDERHLRRVSGKLLTYLHSSQLYVVHAPSWTPDRPEVGDHSSCDSQRL